MKLYDFGLVAVIVLYIAFAYAAGVTNWAYHCAPGGLDPPGCRPAATEPAK